MTGPGLEEGVYAAPAYAGTFRPSCVVTVDGVDVAGGAAAAGDSGLMVVDGLSVTWGREAVLEQPTPGTGRLVLFDPSRTWATRADRRGRPVTIRWEGRDDVTGAAVSGVLFRGRIGAPLTVSPRTVTRARPDGSGETVRGALVEIPLQSAVVDLANVVPRVAWPAETMGARIDRCVTEARRWGLLAGGALLREVWRTPNVAPVAVNDQVSLLDHFTALYDSSGGDSYTYRPDTDALTYVVRRDYQSATMGALTRTTTGPRANRGAYVTARSLIFGIVGDDQANGGDLSTPPATGLFLDTAALEYDPADGVTTPPRITRIAVTGPDEANAYTLRTVEIPVRREPWDPAGGSNALDETALGVRTARVDSLVAWNAWNDLVASDTENQARQEGSRWVLQPLRLVTAKAGGFPSVAVAQLLLAGYERNDNLFLQRSWLPALGIRPVFGVMGATIGYLRGGWDVTFAPAPIVTQRPQHPLTFEDLRTANSALWLQAWDGPHPAGLDPTVTFEDLRYVGWGLDAADPPASTRDEYQS